jgi:hypothetical protein
VEVYAVTCKLLKEDVGVIHSFWDDKERAHEICEALAHACYDENRPERWFLVKMPEGVTIALRHICGYEDYIKMMDTAETLETERAEDRQILQSIGSGSQESR